MDPTVPWPLTMTKAELAACTALCDLILPADGDAPARQRRRRAGLHQRMGQRALSGPAGSNARSSFLALPGSTHEAKSRGGGTFAKRQGAPIQKAIADDIAFKGKVKPGLEKGGEFFARMRSLTVGAFFTTPQGWKVIGYPGNTPGDGPYPGPTPEALDHIKGVIEKMGLKYTPPGWRSSATRLSGS